MIAEPALLSLAFSVIALIARFGRLAKSFMIQLMGKNMIGSLRNGHSGARPPQAVQTQK